MKTSVTGDSRHVSKRSIFRAAALALICLASLFPGGARGADYVLSFSTNTQVVTSTAKVTTSNFTFEAWFKIASFIAENQICAQYTSAGNNAGRMIVAARNAKASFFIGGTWLDGNTTLPSNAWTHIAVTRSGTNGAIYINGVLDKAGTVLSNALPSTGITIGGLNIFNNGFRGQIADVRAWNTVRAQSEIYAAMTTRLTGTESGLVGYWPVNDGTGTNVNELVANADGAAAGTPLPAWAFSGDLPLVNSITIGSWVNASGGNWSDSTKWLAGAVPNGDSHWACFTNQTPATLAVTNNLSPLLVGRMYLANAAGEIFTGNALTFTNSSIQATLSATNGNHAFNLPAVLSSGGLSIDTRTPAALSFGNVLSGAGALTVNPAASGGGTVTLSGSNTYTGPTTLGCGTLTVSTLADGGASSAIGTSSADPANLVIGPATLRYTGPSTTINRGFTLNAGSRKAALLCLDHDLTLTSPITNNAGAFIKTGPGTLTYASPAASPIGRQQSAGLTTQAPYPANGDSPANGFGCFTVAGGKVVLGAHPAQTNLFSDEVTVGAYTTDKPGQEVSAELEIVGGYTRFNGYFDIGYYNGDTVTAPTPLQPKATVSGGTVSANGLIIAFGYQTNQNTRAVLNIAGGSMTVDGDIRFGDQPGNDMLATINVTGGAFIHTSTTVGLGSNRGGNNALNLYGGLVDEYADLKMGANGSTSRVNICGGVLRVRNITGSTGNEYLTFNGGTLQPRTAGYTLSGLTSATVSTNGAVIDTSLASYTITQSLLHAPEAPSTDGGLVKLGTNTLTWASTNSTFTGNTIVSNGTLRLIANLPASSGTLEVGPSGEALIGGNATQTMTFASITLRSGGTLGVAFQADGSTNDRAVVASAADLAAGRFALYQANTTLPFTRNGTYTLLFYSGSVTDVSGMTCANAVYGKTYTFTASGGSVRVTIAANSSTDSVWKTDGSGNWSDAGNWIVAPVVGGSARFDNAITAPATVTVAGQTAGDLFFNNTNTYTLAGSGLTLKSGAAVNVEFGAHTIGAPLTLSGNGSINLSTGTGICLGTVNGASSALTVQGSGSLALTGTPTVVSLALDVPSVAFSNTMSIAAPISLGRTTTLAQPTNKVVTLANIVSGAAGITKTGAGQLALTAANTYSGVTTVNGGTLSVSSLANGGQPSAIGTSATNASNLALSGGTLRYTGPTVTINRGFTVNPGSGKAAILRLDNDLTVLGWINNTAGGFIKTGPGTLRYAITNIASTIGASQSSLMSTQTQYAASGDAPANGFGCLTIAQGKVILGAPGQTNYFNGEATVGAYTTSQAGLETTGELEFIDGYSVFNSLLDIGYYNGTTLTAPTPLQPTVTVSGGSVTAVGLIISFGYNYFGSAYPNTHAVLNIAGGTLNVTGSDFRFGDQPGSGMLATINVTSGALIHSHASAGMGSYRGANNTLNLYGGLVDEYADLRMGTNGSISRVTLNGGILRIRNINGGTGSEYLTFNGGVLQPRTNGQTLANGLLSAVVSTNGALIDTSLASYAIDQKLITDPALSGATDGGLVKLGTNTLTVTGTNTFCGTIDVRGGLLRARVSSTNDLAVSAAAAFDALGLTATVGDLTGEGLLTNGVIAVTGTLDAGTNGAPAGARMTVQNLSLLRSSIFACTWSTNTLGKVTNDFVTVTGTLASEGAGFVDFGRTEANPLPMPFTATVMSYGIFSGSFAGWKALNTGLPDGRHAVLVVSAANNLVTLEVRYGGALIMLK